MIENIQKVRFLNNLYKSFYSYGEELDELTIKKLYAAYFRENPAGSPLNLSPELLRTTEIANVDYINNIMARAIFNMDVLYDASNEIVEDLYSTVTALNARIDSLRQKRTKLEKKVDDLLFSITNSDGFYASFSEEFTSLESMDTKYSSVYLDTESRSISLPTISSGSFNQVANNTSKSNSVKRTLYFNGKVVEATQDIGATSTLIFDGLNDTYYKHSYSASSPGICTMRLDITPLNSSSISRIFGRISSDKKITTMIQLNPGISSTSEVPIYSAQSENDFDNFVFQFEPVILSSASLYLIKNEPDRLVVVNNSVRYEYDFTIRDIVISGPYYDLSGTYVSNPITISGDNTKNTIDAVSVDVSTQNQTNNDISYFIAKNNPDATSIDDFHWIPISPSNQLNKSYPYVVSFNGSSLRYKTILKNSQQNTEQSYKYFSSTKELDVPGFENSSIYRIAKLDSDIVPVEPLILEGYNRYVWYKSEYQEDLCTKLSEWKNEILTDASYNVITSSSEIGNSSSFWTAPSIDSGGSVYISFDILTSSSFTFQKSLTKDDDQSLNWDMSIYLNGILIKRIRPGIASEDLIWNFTEGINNVAICIDAKPKPTSNSDLGLYGSFTLMQQSRISEFGLIYQKYLSYIAPELFKNNNNTINNSFSIAKIDTEKYIITNREIIDNSRFYYYSNNTDSVVDSLRFRIDMDRDTQSSKSSPLISSYRIKFRRTEMLKDEGRKTASEIIGSRG